MNNEVIVKEMENNKQGGTRIWRLQNLWSREKPVVYKCTREKYSKVRCATLNKSYENAFKWQKIWLEKNWNDGHKTKPAKIDLYALEWLALPDR